MRGSKGVHKRSWGKGKERGKSDVILSYFKKIEVTIKVRIFNSSINITTFIVHQYSTSNISHDHADGLGSWIKLGITPEDKGKKETKPPPVYKKLHTSIGLNVKYFIHK